jgi:hypothetical protein
MSLKRGQLVQLSQGDGVVGKFSVHAGIIDAAALTVYHQGQCGALALALAEYTGWPVWWLGSEYCMQDPIDSCPPEGYADQLLPDYGGQLVPLCACQVSHLGVRRPDGLFVDIHGARPMRQVQRDGGYGLASPASPQLLADLRSGARGWARPHLGAARLFAREILASLAR